MQDVMPSEAYEGVFTATFLRFSKEESKSGEPFFKIELSCSGFIPAFIKYPFTFHNIADQMRMRNPGFGYLSYQELLQSAVDTEMPFIIRRRYKVMDDRDPIWHFTIVNPSSFALHPQRPPGG